ncbi:MAG: hypothetical protein ACXWWN_10260 [Gemmatimonadales bacterium]
MTSLLRRASICAGIAVSGLPGLSWAQDTMTVVPERLPVLRRAPLPVAAAPIVQQSPNGLYKLSITDTGIELVGPKGGVKITDTGIEIGAPNTTRIRITTGSMDVRSGQDVRLDAGTFMTIRAGSSLDLRASTAIQVRGDGGASVIGPVVKLGCTSGKAVARAGDPVNTGVILQGSPMVQVC